MITATSYRVEYDEARRVYKICNLKAPYCPACGSLLSGYDTRSRHVIDGYGAVRRFALRRLRCPGCGKLHLELPDFIRSQKHYDARVITEVVSGYFIDCPADDSTIRRWRRENRPPTLPVPSDASGVSSTYTDEKGE